jgi:cysteinyl-tRNA synthetase
LKKTMHDFLFEVLGLVDHSSEGGDDNNKLTGTIDLLIELRNKARVNKDFATSDKIRDQLLKVGIQLKDGKDGTTYSLS